jgi:esterase/lipase
MTAIHRALGSVWKEMRWIDGSSHALTQDAQRLQVFESALEFIQRVEAVAA